jgi:hypothetical protein
VALFFSWLAFTEGSEIMAITFGNHETELKDLLVKIHSKSGVSIIIDNDSKAYLSVVAQSIGHLAEIPAILRQFATEIEEDVCLALLGKFDKAQRREKSN